MQLSQSIEEKPLSGLTARANTWGDRSGWEVKESGRLNLEIFAAEILLLGKHSAQRSMEKKMGEGRGPSKARSSEGETSEQA